MGQGQEKNTHTQSGKVWYTDDILTMCPCLDILRVTKVGELFIPIYLQLLEINRPDLVTTFSKPAKIIKEAELELIHLSASANWIGCCSHHFEIRYETGSPCSIAILCKDKL